MPKLNFKSHHLHHTSLLTIALSLFLIVTFFSSRLLFANTFVLRGLQVQTVNIGGMTYDDSLKVLERHYQSLLDAPMEVVFENTVKKTTLRNLGADYDAYSSIAEAHAISYGRSFSDHVLARARSLVSSTTLEPISTLDREQFEKELKTLFPEFREPRSATFEQQKDGKLKVKAHQSGVRVDFEPFFQETTLSLVQLKVPRLQITGEKLEPSYTTSAADEDSNVYNVLLDTAMIFIFDDAGIPYKQVKDIQPEWVSVKNKQVKFDKEAIAQYLKNFIAPDIDISPQNAVISALPSSENKHTTVEGVPKSGRQLNVASTTKRFLEVVQNNENTVELVVETVPGKIENMTGTDLGELVFLSQGKSNFARSPEGRDFNIRKGLNEKMNNILLAPGETFSYNSYLGNVTYSAGWKGALAIFGGSTLAPVPGGGLCQVSTTVYRAALNAGLKMVERYNHSLYVHYYKAYGDGLDSTVFMGQKDLRFINDTPNYILIQAYADGDDGYVNFYGTPDGRRVELEGPFYYNNVPDYYQDRIKVGRKEIVWMQKIYKSDGSVEENEIRSKYRTQPR